MFVKRLRLWLSKIDFKRWTISLMMYNYEIKIFSIWNQIFSFLCKKRIKYFKCLTLAKVVNRKHLPIAKIVCHFELLLSKSLLLQRNFPRRRMSGKVPKTRRSSCRSCCCCNSMKVKRLCTWDLFYMQLNVFTADQSIRSKY